MAGKERFEWRDARPAEGLNRLHEDDRRSASGGAPFRGASTASRSRLDLGRRPRYTEESPERIPGNCGLMGLCDEAGHRHSGELAIRSMASMHDRGNGLGGGFAGYGIYPDFAQAFCFHMLYNDDVGKEDTEYYLARNFSILHHEPIPTKPVRGIEDPPLLWRYFLEITDEKLEDTQLVPEDYVLYAVMDINAHIDGAFVASSGRNMGAFKGVGFPEEVGEFYRLDEYKGWTWTGHGRFPTNTPGWWGGAHPFCILDYSVVHNGEISSYGINQRYLDMFGYKCTLRTDTEVVAYLFDLMLRRHGLPEEMACKALASPFWADIDLMPEEQRRLYTALRMVYGSALLNGPFAIVLGTADGMVALNDRIKLRPLVAARKGTVTYVASEESAIREICPKPEHSWMPKAGDPVIVRLQPGTEGAEAARLERERSAAGAAVVGRAV